MPICPSCHADIDYLSYNATVEEGGTATLYAECDLHLHERHSETHGTTFSCPKCYARLFDNQDHAIAFLSGDHHLEPTIETDDRPLWSFQYPADPPPSDNSQPGKEPTASELTDMTDQQLIELAISTHNTTQTGAWATLHPAKLFLLAQELERRGYQPRIHSVLSFVRTRITRGGD